MTTIETQDNGSSDSISAIDRAIAATKARKAAKEAAGLASGSEGEGVVAEGDKRGRGRPRLSDEQKAARDAERTIERETAKAQKRAAREEKKSAKAAAKAEAQANKVAIGGVEDGNRQPAHLAKVAKAKSALPVLSERGQQIFNEATVALPAAEISALATNLQFFNREQATVRAASGTVKLNVGDRVRITGGDPKFSGQEGVVSKVQRIRAYVTVVGSTKEAYVFTSDVEVLNDQVNVESVPVTEAAVG